MQKKATLAVIGFIACCLSAQESRAQDAAPWRLYFEAGPKISQFRATSYGGTGNLGGMESSNVEVRNTFSGFTDVKAFKPLSNRVVLSATVGLDMQLLNYRTPYTETYSGNGISAYSRQHISRLLTRARVDWGLHYQIKVGESGYLLPGVTVGQMINLSENGYSYTFLQPGLYYTSDRLLVSFTASDTPYNVLIPGASRFVSTYRGNTFTSESEFRIRELQVSIGAKLW